MTSKTVLSRYCAIVLNCMIAADVLIPANVTAQVATPVATTGAAPDPFIATIAAMKRTVAPVVCAPVDRSDPGKWRPRFVGTGFFVSVHGDFLTANHVLDGVKSAESQACEPGISFALPSTNNDVINGQLFRFSTKECATDPATDIARCRTVEDLSTFEKGAFAPSPVVIDTGRLDDGAPIAMTGFPLGMPVPITARGYIAGYQMGADGPVRIVIDHAAWPGCSGSPVYDADGKVIGMVLLAGEDTASGMSLARSGFQLARFMSEHPLTTNHIP
jgi:S1-C subfamily serine protease